MSTTITDSELVATAVMMLTDRELGRCACHQGWRPCGVHGIAHGLDGWEQAYSAYHQVAVRGDVADDYELHRQCEDFADWALRVLPGYDPAS
jgi:hypothetical protein